MFTKNAHHPHRILNLAIRCMIIMIITGCGDPPAAAPSAIPTVIPTAVPSPKPLPNVKISVAQGSETGDVANVDEGTGVALFVEVEPYEPLDWTWEVSGTSGGTLNTTQGENVVYTSGKAGVDILVAQAKTTDGQLIKQKVTLNVVGISPTPNIAQLETVLHGVFPLVQEGVDFPFPENQPERIKKQFVEEGDCVYSAPIGLQLTYNFPQNTGGGWGVHWAGMPDGFYNLAEKKFTSLTFMVKGISGGEKFQIGLKDITTKEILVQSERYILVSSNDWRPVRIPLSDFADDRGPVDLKAIENMSIGFSSAHGSGTICIDEIAFQ